MAGGGIWLEETNLNALILVQRRLAAKSVGRTQRSGAGG